MSFKHPLARSVISPLGKKLVNEVIDSGLLSYGRLSKQFEQEFSRRHDCRFGVLSNSGTSSLHVALAALKEAGGWKDNDSVIVPATTFVATANIVLMCGLRPIFVDIEPDNFGIDPLMLEQAIEDDTRAIIVAHLFGMPARVKDICEIAQNNGLKVIEDACETVYACDEGLPVGSWGDIGCFSFYVCHTVSAGIGGMSITNDEKLAEVMRSLVNHGRKPGWINGMVSSGDPADRFVFERLGYSYRITEMEAALGLAELQDLAKNASHRLINALTLRRKIQDVAADKVSVPLVHGTPMMLPLLLREPLKGRKFDVMRALEAAGIETREMMPLLSQPFYKAMGHDLSDFPVSQMVKDRGFYVGIYPEMTDADTDYIADVLGKTLANEPILAR